ncbi:MAG: translation elongation factor Ts [Planctomycetota bacterium]|jgi:elongation factor Ts
MADITAATVMKLRKMSGQGMMDCKKALGETDGDLDAAMELLRKKGLATLEKRAGRDTSEGRVLCNVSDDGKTAVMVSLCCETDFVAKGDDFGTAAEQLLQCGLNAAADEGAETLLEEEIDGVKYSKLLTDLVSKTGEKTEVGDYVRYKSAGINGTYVHFNNKVGAMVDVEASSDDVAKAVQTVANEICMHISAMNPPALDKDSVDPELIEKERANAAEQVKNKPAEIIDKIVDGKLRKFLSEICLVDQTFVKDDSKTCGQALADVAKAAGGEAKIKRFVRVEIA